MSTVYVRLHETFTCFTHLQNVNHSFNTQCYIYARRMFYTGYILHVNCSYLLLGNLKCFEENDNFAQFFFIKKPTQVTGRWVIVFWALGAPF